MDHKEAEKLLEITRSIEDALSVNLKISNDQVLDLVVADLLVKYKSTIKRGHHAEESFKEVLLYYLAPSELEMLLK